MDPSLKPVLSGLGLAAVATLSTVASSVVPMGLPLTIINGLVKDFAVNVSSSQLEGIDPKALKEFFKRSGPDISNHDLYKALKSSIDLALQKCEVEYKVFLGEKANKHHLKAVAHLIERLQASLGEDFDAVYGNLITDAEIIEFQQDPSHHLQVAFAEFLQLDDLRDYGPNLMSFLKTRLPQNILRSFTEVIKNNDRAWISYQRFVLDGLRESSLQSQAGLEGLDAKLTLLTTQMAAYETVLSTGSSPEVLEAVLAGFTELKLLLDESEIALDGVVDLLADHQETLLARFDRLEGKLDRLAILDGSSQRKDDTYNVDHLLGVVQDAYVSWGVRNFGSIRLPAVTTDLKELTIPLERVYVALQLISSEDEQAFRFGKQLIQKKLRESEERAQQRHASATPTEDILAGILRDNAKTGSFRKESLTDGETEIVSIDRLFREQRKLLILGDPGGGKSTLLRWLALQLLLQIDNSELVTVAAEQVLGRKVGEDNHLNQISLGPARLPVFIRISEYAEFYHQRSSKRGIIDFCGYHLPTLPEVSAEEFHHLIHYYLTVGQTVILLDGMDEVVKDRDQIIEQIESFLTDWIKDDRSVGGKPGQAGGNQVIISSRHVGYHVEPLRSPIRQVFVREMDETAIRNFCSLWTRQVMADSAGKLPLPEREKYFDKETAGLVNAIFDPTNPRVKSLAANPMMVTILGLLYRHEDRRLPRSRVALYEKSINVLIGKWQRIHHGNHGITPLELDVLLENVAAWIHRSPSEEITESELKELIEDGLRDLRAVPDGVATPGDIRSQSARFIRIVRHDVGLLSEVGDKLYHFLHRSFQEYLAARYLVSERRLAVSRVLQHISDPVWREPVTMAIAYANRHWSEAAFDTFLQDILREEDELESILPRGIMLVASALPDMENLPRTTFRNLVYRFLSALGQRSDNETLNLIRQAIASIVDGLRQGERQQDFFVVCAELLDQEHYQDAHWGILSLAGRDGWYQKDWLPNLIEKTPHDSAAWDWPIDHILLQSFTGDDQATAPKTLTLRYHLERRPDLWEKVTNYVPIQSVLLLLNGGVEYRQEVEEYQRLNQHLYYILLRRSGTTDLLTRAHEVDNRQSDVAFLEDMIPEFSVNHIHRNSPFDILILNSLQRGEAALKELPERFVEEWRQQEDPERAALALLASVAFGTNVEAELAAAQSRADSSDKIVRFFGHLQRIKRSLMTPIPAWRKLINSPPALGQAGFNRLKIGVSTYAYSGILATLRALHIPVQCHPVSHKGNDLHEKESEEIFGSNRKNLILREAEWFAHFNIGLMDDPVYSLAVTLDTSGKYLAMKNGRHLLDIFSQLPYTACLNAEQDFGWRTPDFLFEPRNERDQIVVALRLLHELPDSMQMLREFVIVVLWPLLEDQSGGRDLALVSFIFGGYGVAIAERIKDYWGQGHPFQLAQQNVERIIDPYFRFLTLYYLNQKIGISTQRDLFVQSLRAINDPTEKAQAIILANSSSLLHIVERRDGHLALINEEDSLAEQLLSKYPLDELERPQDRLRMLLYQAQFSSDHERRKKVHLAMDLLPDISDDEVRARQLRLIKSMEPTFVNDYARWPTINSSFKDSLVFNRAMGKEYRTFLQIATLFGKDLAPQASASARVPMLSMSFQHMIRELNIRFGSGDRRTSILREIMEQRNVDRNLIELIRLCRDGVPLTHQFVSLLEWLAEQQRLAELKTLAGLLDPGATVNLNVIGHWQNSFVEILADFYALIATEMGQLNVPGVKTLCRIMDRYDDRWRLRAEIALIGPQADSGNQKRSHTFSQLGYDTLLELSNQYYKMLPEKPRVATVLGWVFHNTFCDDGAPLEKAMADTVNPSDVSKSATLRIGESLEVVSAAAYETIKNLIANTPANNSRSLIKGLAKVHYVASTRSFGPDFLNTDALSEFLVLPKVRQALSAYQNTLTEIPESIVLESLLQPNSHQLDYSEYVEAVNEFQANAVHRLRIDCLSAPASELVKYLYRIGRSSYHNIYAKEQTALELANLFNAEKHDFGKIVCYLIEGARAAATEIGHPASRFDMFLPILAEKYHELWRTTLDASSVREDLYFMVRKGFWTSRMYSLKTLTHWGQIDRQGVRLATIALNDVDLVQKEARLLIESAAQAIDNDALDELISLLDSGRGDQAAAACKVLTRLATQSTLNTRLRQRVIQHLSQRVQQQINDPSRQTFIYERAETGNFQLNSGGEIHFRDSLLNVLYEQLLKLTGL